MSLQVFCDGLCEPTNPGGVGCSAFAVFEDGGDEPIHEQWACIGYGPGMTNNIAEYRAVRAALRWLVKHRPDDHIKLHTDSQLVVEQIRGKWNCNAAHLIPFRNECQKLMAELPHLQVSWIPRRENEYADSLTRIAYREAAGG